MHVVDGFPIYALNQLPAEPYEVVGFIFTSAAATTAADNLERDLVRRAQAEGGQAAVITKREPPRSSASGVCTDYLIVRFKTDPLRPAVDRMKIYLALHPQDTNGSDALDLQKEERQRLQEMIQRHSETRNH
jgi:hypothetical protein